MTSATRTSRTRDRAAVLRMTLGEDPGAAGTGDDRRADVVFLASWWSDCSRERRDSWVDVHEVIEQM